MTKCIFSIDVEEWYMAENIRPFVQDADKTHSSFYVLENLLDTLEEKNIKSTLFVVGKLLKKSAYSKLLKKAVLKGHEIASHTMNHVLLDNLTLKQTRSEIYKSVSIIEDKLGVDVKGFRSPCFSTNIYLEDVLQENNIIYTSNSISASLHDRYGKSKANTKLIDLPIPEFSFLSLKFPVTGGGWFRLFPIWWQSFLLQRKEDFVFYCHPWDFDANQPRISNIKFLQRMRHSINVSKSDQKLQKLLSPNYEYMTAIDFIRENYSIN